MSPTRTLLLCGSLALFANVILRKGVIGPAG